MAIETPALTFLFTFRCSGESHGEPLVEAHVQSLADYDPSVSPDAISRDWTGTEAALETMLSELGFERFDIGGVMGALHDHRDADRRFAVTLEQLDQAGFQETP